jgi:membrane-bound serine protease (ClpP class)
MLGETGLVKQVLNPQGLVLVHGELWDAEADTQIGEGERVQVDLVEGLKIKVSKVEDL